MEFTDVGITKGTCGGGGQVTTTRSQCIPTEKGKTNRIGLGVGLDISNSKNTGTRPHPLNVRKGLLTELTFY